VFSAVARHVDWSVVKCLVVAGPGFAKDTFKAFLDAEAVKRDVRPLIEHKSSIITAQVGLKATVVIAPQGVRAAPGTD
jgi:protein pelota